MYKQYTRSISLKHRRMINSVDIDISRSIFASLNRKGKKEGWNLKRDSSFCAGTASYESPNFSLVRVCIACNKEELL